MKLLKDCWVALVELFNVITLSPRLEQPGSQHVLQADLSVEVPHIAAGGPVFSPPSHPQDPGEVLQCDYSPMGNQWVSCSTPGDRTCWLAGPGGQRFDINTNYETSAPTGITRKVSIALGLRAKLQATY